MKLTGFESCLHLALTQSTKLQQELTTKEESLLLLFRFRVTLSFGADTSQKLPTRADDIYIMNHRYFCSYGVDTGFESCLHLALAQYKTSARTDNYRGIIAASVQMKLTGFESCLHLALTQYKTSARTDNYRGIIAASVQIPSHAFIWRRHKSKTPNKSWRHLHNESSVLLFIWS